MGNTLFGFHGLFHQPSIFMPKNLCFMFGIWWDMAAVTHWKSMTPLLLLFYLIPFSRDLIHRRWITKLDVDESSTSMGSLLIVEFNPTELGQSHLWDIIERITGYVNDVRDVSWCNTLEWQSFQNGVDEEVLASLVKQSNVLFSVTEPGKDVGEMMRRVAYQHKYLL